MSNKTISISEGNEKCKTSNCREDIPTRETRTPLDNNLRHPLSRLDNSMTLILIL